VLLITHDMGIVAQNTHRVLVMYAGQVVEESATSSLFDQRLHPYSEALLGCVPRLDLDDSRGEPRRLISIQGAPPDLANLPKGCRFAPRCFHATALCGDRVPALQAAQPGRSVACFYPLQATGSREPAAIS